MASVYKPVCRHQTSAGSQPEARYYPWSFGPTLGEVLAAQEANDKLGEEGDSSLRPYTTMEINPGGGVSKPRKPREPRKDDLP
ncbi:hypothetical protein VC83_04332 [Pseudogymnoascus destructans]|uniref:Uncharacterized protein n=1 Tax=Pseudogymnoascus destructans TaxID=655981 RepID=A0A177AAQ1_9PEZI|nr:uncharacterized protein VC83_04332 [Pseudogymnoascus destructans]OAF59195.1 hypothetical protein VC83_04332 [Pseudogymnoascus destructans]